MKTSCILGRESKDDLSSILTWCKRCGVLLITRSTQDSRKGIVNLRICYPCDTKYKESIYGNEVLSSIEAFRYYDGAV